MQLKSVVDFLESVAPLEYQESYDNSGLLVGEKSLDITGVLVSLDCTEAIVSEAISKKCNLIIAHHPIIFEGIKRFNNANYIQRTVQLAIKNDIAIYAIHTNLDNVYSNGVNSKIADRLGLKNTHVLRPKLNTLLKLATYCPTSESRGYNGGIIYCRCRPYWRLQQLFFFFSGYGNLQTW
jgi:dinuclear metal center YbgI/SA1388 family protein